ncbi:MAG: UDP-N-acetylmuramate dehydrogenase [Clostridiales bacterium]|nr:UDP-N-acetylmuramate dehydrogenase [Clostridiales bacterium]
MPDLEKILPNIEIRYGEPMCLHTSFKIGGPVQAMVFPKNESELALTVRGLRPFETPSLIVGNGTNLLVAEKPLALIAVKTPPGESGIKQLSETAIRAYCGAPLSRLAAFACESGLSGLEFAHGIPGSVGGAVFMNAGAYGGEVGDFITSVDAVSLRGGARTFLRGECGFSYRHSAFCENGAVILGAVFELNPGDKSEIREKMRALGEQRREKQPLDLPSAGSTFKRPSGAFAAAMIDEAGLRGFRVGGASVSEKHAGFVVNDGGATFDDVLRVIEHVKNEVFRRTGTLLVPEVRIVGG